MPKTYRRFRDTFRRVRKAVKAHLFYVRRREFRILSERHEALIAAFTVDSRLATDAEVVLLKAPEASLAGEICLFVTHATTTELKPHVRAHLESLADAGFAVVLIANTDLDRRSLRIDSALLARLAGCLVRENVGFDFAAWGHAYSLGKGLPHCSRLLLVNDSVVGPLSKSSFTALIERLRRTDADMVGLTENRTPRRHLQSYFLAFGPRALASEAFRRAFLGLRSLPTKELVIDAYETSLTRQLERSGLSAVALFPPLYDEPRSGDDTTTRWRELIDAGFPFVKASLLRSSRHSDDVRAAVPGNLLPPT
jgi:lipopolysaccharide biosynthesis protein